MKPGTLVALASVFHVYLGRLNQPVVAFGERRWTVDWLDGYRDDPARTWSERELLTVVPQHAA